MSDQLIADRIALQDVMLRYAAGVDERDYDLYRSCFADDVEVLDFGSEPVHGGDAWLAYVKKALERYNATQHMLGPQLATVDGDTAHDGRRARDPRRGLPRLSSQAPILEPVARGIHLYAPRDP